MRAKTAVIRRGALTNDSFQRRNGLPHTDMSHFAVDMTNISLRRIYLR